MTITGPKYEFQTPPYDHQRQAIRAGWMREEFAYLMEMGTGKTKVSIDEMAIYWEWGLITGAVVIAPTGVYMNWVEREIPTHMPERIRASVTPWLRGAGGRAQEVRLQAALRPRDGLQVFVINTESLSSSTRAVRYLEQFLRAHRCYVVLDESTFIKNPSAQRTRTITDLARLAAYRRIMTGSPVTRSPLDLYSQFEFLRPGMLGSRSWFAFRARYAVIRKARYTIKKRDRSGNLIDTGKSPDVVVGYRNLQDLSDRLQQHSFRVTKEQCLDLPPKVYTRRDVELTDEQRQMYAEMRDFSLAQLDGESFVSATSVLTKLLRLHQLVCGHVTDDDGVVHEVPSLRLEALMEVLTETQGKVIIWARYRRDIERIVAALRREYGEASVAQFHGGNTQTRQEDARRFIDDPSCTYMVSNQQSGGYGNTWVVASTVVYYSNDYDLEKRMQSEDRAHRSGQTRSVTYVDLVAPGTVDEKILVALRKKINIAEAIMQDGPREWII